MLTTSVSKTNMSHSNPVDKQLARNQQQRYTFIKEWAEYVRTHPDDDWGEQVNQLVNSQLESARHFEEIRPDLDEIDSDLLDS